MRKYITLPISIVMASIVFGAFFYATQLNKQQSIEKQQRLELEENNRIEQTKIEQNEVVVREERKIKEAKENCIVDAHERYVQEGQRACFELGYTQEDFDNMKCKLPLAELKRLEEKQAKEQEFCLKAYEP